MTRLIPALALAAAIGLASCGGGSGRPRNLTGAGATFPYPLYSKWFNEYQKLHPLIQINYQSQGSGAGIRQVTEGTVDFGASDQPMTDEQLEKFEKARGMKILHFPTVMGAVVPTYNLPGVDAELNFTPAALAGIFLGKITKWNDPAIASVNPEVRLPDQPIVVVHRSDGSGTTFVWVDYLAKISPEWAAGPGVGTAVSWPVGLGGKGNEGVMGLLKQTPYSLGYAEVIFVLQNKLPMGRVQNAAGKFVKATAETITAAAAAVPMPEDFRVSITNPSGENAFPISSFTWLLVPEVIPDSGKREVLTDFLRWMLGPGQAIAREMDYAPLPANVIAQEEAAIARIR
jgi:phosphate transport system substrate-binding protein